MIVPRVIRIYDVPEVKADENSDKIKPAAAKYGV